MKDAANEPKERPEPAKPNQEADSAKVPPASETWVEGQPASDADYGGGDEPGE